VPQQNGQPDDRPAGRAAGRASSMLAALLRQARPAGPAGHQVVAEPFVKDFLRSLGIPVVRGATAASVSGVLRAADGLRPPLVLKAWGPGIVHKTEAGAVRLGLSPGSLAGHAREMQRELAARNLTAEGFLVEEQAAAGVELLMGVVRREPLGCIALVGLGGVLAEALDDVAARLCPVGPGDAAETLGGFRGAVALGSFRGRAASSTAAAAVLLAIAGLGGAAELLGSRLAELECNPVIVNPDGAVVADARLVLRDAGAPGVQRPRPALDSASLFRPGSIAVAGASATRTTIGNRALRRYRSFGWTAGLYAIHPTAASIDGVPAVPSLADIPGGADYLLVALPAAACPAFLRSAAGHARVAQVVSSGFRESGPAGMSLEAELTEAGRDAGVRFLGPNCLGVYAPAGRQSLASAAPREPGGLSAVLQSGGLAADLIALGARRGLRFAKVISAGNAADVSVGELAGLLADDEDTRVLGVHVEGCPDRELAAALRRCRGRRPAVVLAAGASTAGGQAAASHTGGLAGDERTWAAFAAWTSATVVRTLEEFVAVLAHLDRYAGLPAPVSSALLIVGIGGGASVLAADACDAGGLPVTPLGKAARRRLGRLLGGEAMTANPVDAPVYQGAPSRLARDVITAIAAEQPVSDVLLHADVAMYYLLGAYSAAAPGSTALLAALDALAALPEPAHRIALVLRNLDAAPGADASRLTERAARLHIPAFRTFGEAVAAIAGLRRFDATRAGRHPEPPAG